MEPKIIVITGANSGIGKITALELAKTGATIVMACRNEAKAIIAMQEIKSIVPTAILEFVHLDLANLESVRNAAAIINSKFTHLDVLINNAGLYIPNLEFSTDGFELTMASNHLGHFLFTGLLIQLILKSKQGRIIHLSSDAHKMGKINFETWLKPSKYSAFKVYGDSKLANIYFSNILAKKLKGTHVTSNSLHPGVVSTNFGSEAKGILGFIIKYIAKPFMISDVNGAKTSIFLATDPTIRHTTGKYFNKCKVASTSSLAQDETIAQKFWDETEKALNFKFEIE